MASTPQLPRDALSQSIQALSLYTPSSVSDSVLVASRSIALPTDSSVFALTVTQACWVAFGGASVTATPDTAGSTLLLPGERVFAKRKFTHVAYIRESADGKISITSLL